MYYCFNVAVLLFVLFIFVFIYDYNNSVFTHTHKLDSTPVNCICDGKKNWVNNKSKQCHYKRVYSKRFDLQEICPPFHRIALKATACVSICLQSSATPVYSVPVHTTGQQLLQQVAWHGFDIQCHAT